MDINTHGTLKANLAAYWTLDANMNDSAGSSHGTFTGSPTFPVAKLRTGVKLNGSSQYGSALGTAFTFPGDWSVAFWFYVDTWANNALIFSAGDPGSASRVRCYLTNGNKITFYTRQGDIETASTFTTGVWYHVMLTCANGENAVFNGYVNNVIDANITARGWSQGGSAGASDGSMFIGYRPGYSEGYFTGRVDEFGGWHEVLSSDERTDLYQGGIGITWDGTFTSIKTHPTLRSGLLAHYKMDGDANDSLGNYNGTPQNAPTYAAGKLGQAINLNGSNQYVDLGYHAGLNPDYISVCAWMKRDSNTGYSGPIGKRGSLGHSYDLGFDGGSMGFYCCNEGGMPAYIQLGGIVDGTWQLWAGVFDGNLVKISLNGGEFSIANMYGKLNKNLQTTYLGRLEGYYNLDGCLDEITIHDRPLFRSEIQDLYNSGAGLAYETGLPVSGTFASVQSGLWSDPATWGDVNYPGAGSLVTINIGHTVEIDGNHTCGTAPSNTTTMVLTIRGTLKWKDNPTADWTFNCRGNVYVKGGLLQIGSESVPIPSTRKANFIFQKSTSSSVLWHLRLMEDGDNLPGKLEIFGSPSYHMGSAPMQRARLAADISLGSDRSLVFDQDVDYQVGDTVWIGMGGSPTVDIFGGGSTIIAGIGTETVTIKTKVSASSYTADFTYNHYINDLSVQLERNVRFGTDSDTLSVAPHVYRLFPDYIPENAWGGYININWAYLNRVYTLIYRLHQGCQIVNGQVKCKNSIARQMESIFYRNYLGPASPYPWTEVDQKDIDEVHFLGGLVSGIWGNHVPYIGHLRLGHISILDNPGGGSVTAVTDGSSLTSLIIDGLWLCYHRTADFNYTYSPFQYCGPIEIRNFAVHNSPVHYWSTAFVYLHSPNYQAQTPCRLIDGEFHNVGTAIVRASGTIQHLMIENVKFRNCGGAGFRALLTFECGTKICQILMQGCSVDKCGGVISYTQNSENRTTIGPSEIRFLNCTFGTVIRNTLNVRISGAAPTKDPTRWIFENCIAKIPTGTLDDGLWIGAKAYFVKWSTDYQCDAPTTWDQAIIWNSNLSIEFSGCKALNASDVDQWPIEYPNCTSVAVVGGMGEVRDEQSVVIDGSLAMKMVPYSPLMPMLANHVCPIKVPVIEGEGFVVKTSLRKNISLPEGYRPAVVIHGAGYYQRIEMSDSVDTWEEMTFSGTAQYEDIVEVEYEGGINTRDGTIDCLHPSNLGTVISYADKFSLSRVASPYPKVSSVVAISPTKVKVAFSLPMLRNTELTSIAKYTCTGGLSVTAVELSGHKSVLLTLSGDMTSGSEYTVGVVATSGFKDVWMRVFDEDHRSSTFTRYTKISDHPTLMERLVACYMLNGDALDSGPNGYHGEISGSPTTVAGKIGNGLAFNANSGIWIPPEFHTRRGFNSPVFTACMWVKGLATGGGSMTPFGRS